MGHPMEGAAQSAHTGCMSLLKVEGLVKRFGDRTVVKGVSFEVHAGEIVGLLGPNGAGKTTSFRMTVGMIPPDAGRVSFDDVDVTRMPMFRRARLGLGYLSQEPSIFRHMTVRENLLAVLEALGLDRAQQRARSDELVEEFGLGHVARSVALTLSGGERRRLELARTLALDPRLILLDEPFSGVDPIAVEDIQQQLFRLRERGIAVLITDHAVRETLGTTDRAYIIYEGSIFRQGSAEVLANDDEVRAVYLGQKFSMPDAGRGAAAGAAAGAGGAAEKEGP
jgi:lipopolysaccharide export system ATP-binding protein